MDPCLDRELIPSAPFCIDNPLLLSFEPIALQTTSFLKLRWFVGTAFLAVPVALSHYRAHHYVAAPLPKDAVVHIAIAWAVGALMSFLADTYRRCELMPGRTLVSLHMPTVLVTLSLML